MSERFNQIYQEERDNLSQLPNADDDFVAYENALKRFEKEKRIIKRKISVT